ncbi:MAG: Coenzyme F420 hydrogenase/dehydrogenase, beta subunit C-terminal domain [Solobacterium sp.]|nr:Coenzyme F420 hydrogenase/dehydrogenase, beta subunit C-terminal domain [Solobacterium sp.]MCI7357937.1 Coenzyme F420 hydrogenase/dehydrogenase, beta subunit C-terminal domain [Parabacteroides sp.]
MLATKETCTGCMACVNSCKFNAIELCEDNFGFKYPLIQNNKCINCGLCQKACPILNSTDKVEPLSVFAAINKNMSSQMNASSAGVFGVLAEFVLNAGGVVYGCAWGNDLEPCHIRVDNLNDLYKLKKSKYVQSKIGNTYQDVKKDLQNNKFVLFSGTPCQVDGLNHYLQFKKHNLFTVDVVCHGVPSYELFEQFKRLFEKKHHCKINEYDFRYKSEKLGGYITRIKAQVNRTERKYYYPWQGTSYSFLFMNSYICRDSCYNCRYACNKRVSDITIGDFWGAKEAMPQIDTSLGVSLILINSVIGETLTKELHDKMTLFEVDRSVVLNTNPQLNHTVPKPKERKELEEEYSSVGYDCLEEFYQKRCKDRLKYIGIVRIKRMIPQKIYRMIVFLLKGFRND